MDSWEECGVYVCVCMYVIVVPCHVVEMANLIQGFRLDGMVEIGAPASLRHQVLKTAGKLYAKVISRNKAAGALKFG